MADGREGSFGTRRSAGILLHPTSLPGPYGIGELGPEAFRFVDFLRQSGQRVWQILPLNPPDAGGSPYSSPSAFAGSPLLVSTERLVSEGLLERESLRESRRTGPVDYPAVAEEKAARLRRAYANAEPAGDEGFQEFREEKGGWLEDYALFAALKERYGGKPWNLWGGGLAQRDPGALADARRELAEEIGFHEFVQYLFFSQWTEVRRAANAAGVEVFGDVPIFVSHDSADVWRDQRLFQLDGSGSPTVVAGVPPDYFSETGQLWGNPLYDWDRMAGEGYEWWERRLRNALSLYDLVRIDHFRGFESYWEVPAGAETAVEGRWVEGPGTAVFEAFSSGIGAGGALPIVAEDLGDVGPEVEELRAGLGLPGMKVLQFAFSGPDNAFLPHNYGHENWVAYTGTHDNDTTAGWWRSASPEERAFARRYLGREHVTVEDLVRAVLASVAARAVVPMQDVLGLGTEARLNTPGTAEGNWGWRLEETALTPELAAGIRELTELYGR